jgi:hypothetical protein
MPGRRTVPAEAPAQDPARTGGRRAEQPDQVTAERRLIAGDSDDGVGVPGRQLGPHLRGIRVGLADPAVGTCRVAR